MIMCVIWRCRWTVICGREDSEAMSKSVPARAAAIPPSQWREQRGAQGMKWSAERSGVCECARAVDRRCRARK